MCVLIDNDQFDGGLNFDLCEVWWNPLESKNDKISFIDHFLAIK